MDVISYALSKKIAEHAVSGVQSMSVSGQTLTINTKDSGVLTMTFPTPKDGVSVTDIDVNANNQIVFTMSDGTEFISGKIPTVKGDKGDKLTFNDLTDEEKASLKGSDGFSPSAKIEKVGDTATITITDKDGTTTATIKDGQGGGTADVPIEKIKVNGELQTPVNKVVDITVPSIDGLAKTEDIPTKVSELTNDSGYLTEHQDISGKVDKVDGKSLIADSEITRLASVDNYDDTQVKSQIQAVANGLMDSVGYSADYKTIDIIAKNGVKKSVNVAPIISHASITELSDVDITNKATGKALVYNATTSKHEYADVSGTDEKVKMDASTDAKYLGELLDNVTIANENGELKVKKLDGQEVTITEINYLKGLTMNVMDLVNMFSNGGVKIINTPVATYAELLTLDKSSFIEGISYLVYVLADENHDNAKTTYLVDKDSETPTYFGFADSQRDFTTNPIDLATEITGKLGIANMDSDAIKALFTVDNTYKTETATNNAFSTHGAKALYDELLLAIGNKANDSDLTAHKDDADIHVSTEDRTKWDSAKTHADSAHAPSNAQANVLETVKVNGTALEVSNKAVNVTVPTTVSELTDSDDYAKTTDIPTTLPANGGNASTVNGHTVESDVPSNAKFTDTVYDDTEVQKRISDNGYGEIAGGKNLLNHNIIDSKIKNCSVLFKNDTFYVTNKGSFSFFVLSVPTIVGKSYTVTIKDWSDYSYRCIASVSDLSDNSLVSMVITDATLSMTFTAVGTESLINISPNNTANEMSNTITFKCMLEEGSVATDYEPYFQSNKMLASESVHQRTEAMDLKMLGWTVPSECPVQNYVDGDGVFHQRVGRVDLGSLDLTYVSGTNSRFACSSLLPVAKYIDNDAFANAYCTKYIVDTANNIYKHVKDKTIHVSKSSVWIYDTTYTDATIFNTAMKGVYLYYELETEITKPVDGNEAISKVNESLSVIGKCKNLLNPILETTTQNGVTCTRNVDANGNPDGTYTLNGTATSEAAFYLIDNDNIQIPKGMYKTICSTDDNIKSAYYFSNNGWILGNQFEITQSDILSSMWIKVQQDYTCDNVIIKPMLTTNLNATYDDFVPYTGDGKTLTHDVAKLNDSLGTWEEFKITPISATSSNYAKGFYNDALKLVKIEFESFNTNGWNSQNILGIIPEKYRPKTSRFIGGCIYISNQQMYCPFEIKENGSIIQKMSSGTYTQARCFGIYNI